MRNKFNSLLYFFLLISSVLLSQPEKPNSIIHIKSNLEFLADDLLEGREAASRGEKIASLYISKQLQKYCVEPFGDDGTYFQDFPILLTGIDPGAVVGLKMNDDTTFLKLGDDFIYSSRSKANPVYSGIEGEIVFAGYGVTADDFDYDDYRDLDVKGKFVLVFDDMPVSDNDTVFSQSKHRRYGFWSTKTRIAQDHGAAGIIIIPSVNTLEYWDYFSGAVKRPNFQIYDSTETYINNFSSIPVIGLNRRGLDKLLDGEKYSSEQLLKYLGLMEIPEPFELSKSAVPRYSYYSKIKNARNVIGVLEGNDENLKNEFVTISAHYDHEGKLGDIVFNGADDDGSGTVGVLETARQIAQLHSNKRSILFIFHTGEEKGLLGSKYLTSHVDWIHNAVVNINMDMIGRESIDSIYCIGSDKLSTELYELVESVNSAGDYFTLDYRFNADDDPNRFYWRSDHIHYAEKGIPVVFFFDYMTKDYHRPTDTVDKINFQKIYKVVSLVKGIALSAANKDHKLFVDKSFK